MTDRNVSDEQVATSRYLAMNGARIVSLATVILGITIARNIVPAPYWLGVVLAVGGMIAFFFAPPLMARRWKAGDRAQSNDEANR